MVVFLGISAAIKFEMTKFGNPTISWGNYRFIKKLTRRMKTWWECTARKSSGCRCVAVTVDNQPKFGLSQRGNLIVQIGDWRFNKHACWGSKVRWTCIKKKYGCTAAITTVDNVIVKTLGKHNH
ncbi:unnamed protein product [Parnassius mnemosyne]|uniref:FLYWCH-type domain-containing protein n=1 Tax=Parnassius mnemosyne TaxID=213953 RepID=A0AAV1K9I7_9NEOP